MLLKLGQITHNIIVSNREIFLQLIIKGLSADLDANTQCDVDIND